MAGRTSVRFSWIERSIRHGRKRSVPVDGMVAADSVVRGVPEGEDDEEQRGRGREDGKKTKDKAIQRNILLCGLVGKQKSVANRRHAQPCGIQR
jgi:hypothetical protein